MENAADALKMSAAILIFVIAIASSFSLFGTAKQTADSIIGMRNKQKYLEASQLDTVLYTSSSKIKEGNVQGITSNGDRIVNISDVFSTIYRYSKEKYGVTIMKSDGTIIARYDSNTENIMRQYYKFPAEKIEQYAYDLNEHTKNSYVEPKFYRQQLEKIYKVQYNGKTRYGAPWYGNNAEIIKRINADISKSQYSYNGYTYEGKGLFESLKGKTIIEVTNEIDQGEYLKDNNEDTQLLQEYKMPTVEIVYILR